MPDPETATPDLPASSAATAYLGEAQSLLAEAAASQAEAIARAAEACTRAVERDGLIYIFGTGHSHLMAEEGHFRAGGLACVVPILATSIMLHEGALVSTRMERMSGLAEIVMSRYPLGPDDALFVFSTSGVNAVPVEAARYGRERGTPVIGVTSLAYSTAAAKGRQRLADVADVVLDTGAPPGDAIAPLGGGLFAGPVSTIIGAAFLNAVLVQCAANLIAGGREAPVYRSANMPGAVEHNLRLAERYAARNPHL